MIDQIRSLTTMPSSFNIALLNMKPRIYYKRIGIVRLKRADSRIVIALDVERYLKEHAHHIDSKAIRERCDKLADLDVTTYYLDPDTDLVNIKLDQIEMLKSNIREITNTIGQPPPHMG